MSRYYYELDQNNNIYKLDIEQDCEFNNDVFPYDEWLWLPDTQESIQIKKGFFGNSLNKIANKHTILRHLKIIIERKKKGWEAYQIKGLSKDFITYVNEHYGITIKDIKGVVNG